MQKGDLQLWKQFKKSGDPDARGALLENNLPLVRFTLERMTVPVNRAWLDMEDLVTAGIIGLIDAMEKFNPSLGGKFSTYAFFRIRGAVLDELRAMDWVPRSVRQKARELEQAYEALERRLHRPVTDQDLARKLGLTLRQYHHMLKEINVPPVISLEELLEDDDHKRRDILAAEDPETRSEPGAFRALAARESREILADVIEELPERERLVLTLYYYEELTMKEIAAILEVTESRVCQIHGQAICHLRAGMRAGRQDFILN